LPILLDKGFKSCNTTSNILERGVAMLSVREFNFAGFYYFYWDFANKSDTCCIDSKTEGK
jgi:hypothetical protein